MPNGDFESGNKIWTEFSQQGFPIILSNATMPEVPVSFGDWSAWLGGVDNEYSSIEQQVIIPPGLPFFSFNLYIHSYDICGTELIPPTLYDTSGVEINGNILPFDLIVGCTFELCTPRASERLIVDGTWYKLVYNLTSFGFSEGQPITIKFWADTDSSNTSSLFIDNVAFQNRFDDEGTIVTGLGIGNDTGFSLSRVTDYTPLNPLMVDRPVSKTELVKP